MGIPYLFYSLRYRLPISRHGVLQKLFGASQQLHPFPACTRPLQNLLKLFPYFLIRDMRRPLLIPGKVSQMHQERQHVIPALEGLEVILEPVRPHLDFLIGYQPGDGLHVDIGHQGFRRRCPLPVGAALLFLHGAHHGIGVVDSKFRYFLCITISPFASQISASHSSMTNTNSLPDFSTQPIMASLRLFPSSSG